MSKKETLLVGLKKEIAHHPGFAVCYARGSVFKPEGRLFRVEKGKRAIVSRLLCLRQVFRRRCRLCPHSAFTATFEAKGAHDLG
jgi:hypothetical protein